MYVLIYLWHMGLHVCVCMRACVRVVCVCMHACVRVVCVCVSVCVYVGRSVPLHMMENFHVSDENISFILSSSSSSPFEKEKIAQN